MSNIRLVLVVSCPLCRRYQDSEFALRSPSHQARNQIGLQALFSCFNPWRLESLRLTTRYFYKLPFTISWHTCFAQENGLTANSDYRIGSQIMENTWSFKTITFEESAIFMIKIGVITQSVILRTIQHLCTWPILAQPTLSDLVCVSLKWNVPSQDYPTNSSHMKTTCTYVNSTNHATVFNLQPCELSKKAWLSIKFAHHEWRINL